MKTRDPSDGSVKPATDARAAGTERPITGISPAMPFEPGLPLESQKTKDQAKLEKSREWLKEYFKRNPEQGT